MVELGNSLLLKCRIHRILCSHIAAPQNQVAATVDTNGALDFNIGHWFKSAMVFANYLYWKLTFEDVLYFNFLMDIVESNVIPLEKTDDDEDNSEYKMW